MSMARESNRRQCLVLLVEDDVDTYELYSDVLASAGFAVIGADSGEDAVRRAVESAPDIIVMDYDLRGMDGALATEMLKRDPRTHAIPVMMLTGHVALRQIDRARKAGCDAFLSKPCPLDKLLDEVRHLLAADENRQNGSIMIVEDDEGIRAALGDLLREDGFQVTEAGHGRVALDLLRRSEVLPDIILLDLAMPVMDGWTFRSHQLADPRLAAIPVVILSATNGVPEHARELGVDDFLPKPFSVPDLLDAIERISGASH
jgi:CheY-like chemotaxis protein